MNKKPTSSLFGISICFVVLLGFVFNKPLFAQEYKHDHIFVVGIGYMLHGFSEEDSFRKATGDYAGDQINAVAGPEAYLEFFLGKYFTLGAKYQRGNGGFIYRVYANNGSAEVERIVTITNSILYGNLSVPMGSSSWRLGLTAGAGSTKYAYSFECTKAEGSFSCLDKYQESSDGTVTTAGLFADWGADGFGGRMGFSSIQTKYDDMPDIDGKIQTPSGSGMQTFINLRYAY